MKIIYAILICIVLIIIGYIVGQYVPFVYLHPDVIADRNITLNDYYTKIISLAGTIATILAVLIALFKEDIRQLWDKANLTIRLRDNTELHEILDSETSSPHLRAHKYETILLITNTGTQSAKNCEIYLEELQFINSTYPKPQDIPFVRHPLKWHNNPNNVILIPATGKALVSILEIISAESQSVTPEEAARFQSSPKIRIGETDSPEKYSNGKWIAKFRVYSENAKPVEHHFIISWNNQWENRITEMAKCVKIESKINQ